MALNRERLMLAEGSIQSGTWIDPENIGFNTDDPLDSFINGEVMGYFKQGTTNIALQREYAQALSGTPGQRIRQDLTRKMFDLEAAFFQIDTDNLEKNMGMFVIRDHVTTSSGAKLWDMMFIGDDEPVQANYGLLLTTAYPDKTPIYFAVWFGRFVAEDISITLPGTDYPAPPMKGSAFPHPNFDDIPNGRKRNLGIMLIDKTNV